MEALASTNDIFINLGSLWVHQDKGCQTMVLLIKQTRMNKDYTVIATNLRVKYVSQAFKRQVSLVYAQILLNSWELRTNKNRYTSIILHFSYYFIVLILSEAD